MHCRLPKKIIIVQTLIALTIADNFSERTGAPMHAFAAINDWPYVAELMEANKVTVAVQSGTEVMIYASAQGGSSSTKSAKVIKDGKTVASVSAAKNTFKDVKYSFQVEGNVDINFDVDGTPNAYESTVTITTR